MGFAKSLTMSDVESRLVLPNELFADEFSPPNIWVRTQNAVPWALRLSSMRNKRVVSAGWLSFVRERNLKAGDSLSIFRDTSQGDRASFRIEVKRQSEKTSGSLARSNEWVRLF